MAERKSFDPDVVARSSPAAFAMQVTDGRWKPFDHLLLLDSILLKVCFGDCRRLMVFMPPRHGKSRLISEHLPAFWLGRFPDRKVILSSYAADFAASWGGKARGIVEEYGPRLFNIGVNGASRAADRWDIAGRDGGMNTAGVGGPVTGKGADLLIIDDPVKNAEEANSPVMREKVWDWWLSTASTRLSKNGVVVLVMTRWHEDDLAGRLLAEMRSGGEKWEVLSLPAIAEESEDFGIWKRKPGDALCPQLFPIPRLEEIRKRVGSYWWAALYQQRPAPVEGGIFKRDWFRRRYRWLDEKNLQMEGLAIPLSALRLFATVDLAASTKETADFTVIAVWGVLPGRPSTVFLLDLVHKRMEGPDIEPALRAVLANWRCTFVAVEKVGFQLALVQQMRRNGLPVREYDPDRDKVSRALAVTPACEAGRVVLPRSAPWLETVERELFSFPNAMHDDIVDCISAMGEYLDTTALIPNVPRIVGAEAALDGMMPDLRRTTDALRDRDPGSFFR